MEMKEYEEYIGFTESFLDTIDISRYIKQDGMVRDTIRQIEDCDFRLYKAFCEKAHTEGTLPEIVEKEDPEFREIFNLMDESDFIDYIERRYGKNMTYEVTNVTNYWMSSNFKK